MLYFCQQQIQVFLICTEQLIQQVMYFDTKYQISLRVYC